MATHGKDDWRLCAEWLVRCQILVEGHKVTWESAQVFDLAQVLRDGVLICHLLNRLFPTAIDQKEFSQRPQMSQFLCLKNIRVFLQACKNVFKLDDRDLFEPYDLFEVKDFGKVIKTLAKLSNCPVAQKSQIPGFDLTNEKDSDSKKKDYTNLANLAIGFLLRDRARKDDDDIYGPLSEIAVDCDIQYEDEYDPGNKDEEEEDIYSDVIYGTRSDLVSDSTGSQPTSKRDYCIKEILETEKNYTDALNMICTHFIHSLKSIIPSKDHETIFFGIEELRETHKGFHGDLVRANNAGSRSSFTATTRITIPDCFVQWKEKFLIYGDFCSNLPKAQELVDELCNKNPIINSSVQDCQMKANQGKFRLRDLLSVPMQRVLKYHLLLKELTKNTNDDHPEKRSLERALEEMQDLSLYVNEVKRDNEQLQFIQEIANSIIDLQMPTNVELKDYGRIQLDGELKVKNHEDHGRNKTRYVFVFDKVMLQCKSRIVDKFFWGDCYNFRDALVLSQFRVEKVDSQPKAQPKAEKGWQFPFLLVKKPQPDGASAVVWTIFCKTEEMRRKWMDAIEMAQDNTSPEGARDGGKDFIMFSFSEPTICDVCRKLLRGVFFQGYKCQKTGLAVHKGCVKEAKNISGPPVVPPPPSIPGTPPIGPTVNGSVPVPPRRPALQRCKATQSYHGDPLPGEGRQVLTFCTGDSIELVSKSEGYWSEGRLNGKTGFFPSHFVTKEQPTRRPSYEPAVIREPKVSPPLPVTPGNHLSLPGVGSNGVEAQPDLSQLPWFVGQMARDTAVRRLEPHKSGTYLIRERVGTTQNNGEYALSIKYIRNVKHIKVQKSPDNHFFLADSHMFRTIPDMISHYQRNTLGNSFPELPTMLTIPFKDSEKELQSGAGAAAAAIGICKAIYGFAANQSNQLSLEVNDLIEIISKAGGDRGWWKGRKGNKTGYFPSAYVQEDGDV